MNNQYFLISCVGAYADSGIGTGGFVIYDGYEALTVDKFDTTGLFKFEANYFRFIRSEKALIGYNNQGVFYQCKFPEVLDCHDILIEKDSVMFVSTCTNQILYYDFLGKLHKTKKLDGDGDAWHLNCLVKKDEKYYLSAFGNFKEHRQWHKEGCAEKGFLFDLNSDKIHVDGLSGPHTPRFIDNKLFICNSHKNSLRIFDCSKDYQDIYLGGFTRGICFDENFIYVGVSANRKSQTQLSSKIVVLERENYKIVKEIFIPYPEIYDILICDEELTLNFKKEHAKFQIIDVNPKIQALTKQVELSHKSSIKLQNELTLIKNRAKLYGKVKKTVGKFFK